MRAKPPAKPKPRQPASDPTAAQLEIRLDPDAPPGNVLPALAALLISLTRRKEASQK